MTKTKTIMTKEMNTMMAMREVICQASKMATSKAIYVYKQDGNDEDKQTMMRIKVGKHGENQHTYERGD